MATTLLETGRAPRARPGRAAHPALSVAAHAAALAVLGGDAPPPVAAAAPPPAERITYAAARLRVVDAPPARGAAGRAPRAVGAAGVPRGAVRLRTPVGVPERVPPAPSPELVALAVPVVADVVDAVGSALDPARIAPSADELAPPGTGARLAEALAGYPAVPGSHADLFERGIVAFDDNPHPRYPSALLAAAVEGAVRVAFVVDTTGHADPRTVRVIVSSNEQFTRAVRRVVPRLRFRPALSGPAPVAVLVEQQFVFALR